jgi:hypothetical protein
VSYPVVPEALQRDSSGTDGPGWVLMGPQSQLNGPDTEVFQEYVSKEILICKTSHSNTFLERLFVSECQNQLAVISQQNLNVYSLLRAYITNKKVLFVHTLNKKSLKTLPIPQNPLISKLLNFLFNLYGCTKDEKTI